MSEVTFEPYQRVLVRDNNQQEWRASFYSHAKGHGHRCINDYYLQCIPYNEETAHLLGTTDSPTPPELEFKWGDHVEVRNDEDEQWRKAVFCSIGQHNYFYCLIEPSGCCLWALCRHADW